MDQGNITHLGVRAHMLGDKAVRRQQDRTSQIAENQRQADAQRILKVDFFDTERFPGKIDVEQKPRHDMQDILTEDAPEQAVLRPTDSEQYCKHRRQQHNAERNTRAQLIPVLHPLHCMKHRECRYGEEIEEQNAHVFPVDQQHPVKKMREEQIQAPNNCGQDCAQHKTGCDVSIELMLLREIESGFVYCVLDFDTTDNQQDRLPGRKDGKIADLFFGQDTGKDRDRNKADRTRQESGQSIPEAGFHQQRRAQFFLVCVVLRHNITDDYLLIIIDFLLVFHNPAYTNRRPLETPADQYPSDQKQLYAKL